MGRLATVLLLLTLCGCGFVCDSARCYTWAKPVVCEGRL